MDQYGYHLLSCQFNEGRHPQHGAINDIICRALKSAGLASIMEPVGLSRDDGKRPNGISIFPFSNGKALCWDVTWTGLRNTGVNQNCNFRNMVTVFAIKD